MRKFFLFPLLVCAFVFLIISVQAQGQDSDKIIISGSSTVHNFVFHERMDEWIEKVGYDFDAILSSSGRGVLALVDGKNDIAGISSDFPSIVEKLSVSHGLNIDIDDYVVHPISKTKVLFIVHPENPIREMTHQQVKDVFTGKIKNWDVLGVHRLGKIKVVTEHPTGGIYNTVLYKVTDQEPITEDKIAMQNGPQSAIVVSQMPNSFGMLSDVTPQNQRYGVVLVDTPGFEAVQNMYFVTKKGDEREKVMKIIQTVQDAFK